MRQNDQITELHAEVHRLSKIQRQELINLQQQLDGFAHSIQNTVNVMAISLILLLLIFFFF